MAGIFISYRRQDSADVSGRIYEHLVARYGKAAVFMDVDTIPYGEDFAQYIQDEMHKCSVVLVVIGPGWLKAETTDGQQRLNDPGDFVRIEIETALHQEGLTVVPLLVSGAKMPPEMALPEKMRGLHRKNAAQARPNPDFETDMKRLCESIDRHMPRTPVSPPQSAPVYVTPVTPAISLPKLKPSRRTVRRTVTTLLIIATVVLLLCAGGVFGIIKLQQALFPPDPTQTAVRAFCASLNAGDIDAAYNDLSSNFKGRATKDTFLVPPDGIGGTFVHCADGAGYGGCTNESTDACPWPEDFKVSGGTKDGDTLPYTVYTIQEHGAFKIDSITTPIGTST